MSILAICFRFLKSNCYNDSINLHYCQSQAIQSNHIGVDQINTFAFASRTRSTPISHSTPNILPDILQWIQWKANDKFYPLTKQQQSEEFQKHELYLHLSSTANVFTLEIDPEHELPRPNAVLDHRIELYICDEAQVQINQSLWCVQLTSRCEMRKPSGHMCLDCKAHSECIFHIMCVQAVHVLCRADERPFLLGRQGLLMRINWIKTVFFHSN